MYLVGIAQLLLLGLSVALVEFVFRKPVRWDFEQDFLRGARATVRACADVIDRDEELRRVLSYAEDLGFEATIYSRDGKVRAHSGAQAMSPLGDADVTRLAGEGAFLFGHGRNFGPKTAIAIERRGIFSGYGLVQLGVRPPRPNLLMLAGVVLGGVAIVSFLFARSLARPLLRLAEAARAFGSGDLTARTHIHRKDEVGEVARTFDEMAERVNVLLHSQREVLANVSHELRTPLARIRVALDIAAEGDVAAARQSLLDIAEDWNDLERLVEDVLTVARLDLAHDRAAPDLVRYESVDPRLLVERVAMRFQALHPNRALAVDCRGRASQRMWADPSLLRRVFDNLLSNAAKYSEAGTIVGVAVQTTPVAIEFTVADRGIGIGGADLPHVFTPFFRSDRSRARKTGGAGLGLALVKRIVEAHQGTIGIESHVGIGTTVRFTIPALPATRAA